MDHKLIRGLVIGHCCLHLSRIVAVAKLSEAEAANGLKVVNLVEQVIVAAVVQGQSSATEKIHLDSVLDGHRGINQADELVGAKHIHWVRVELTHREVLGSPNLLELLVAVLSAIVQVSVVVDRGENWVTKGLEPCIALLGSNVEKTKTDTFGVHWLLMIFVVSL